MTPVILSGGSGTRLWPVSRSKFPKQFSQLFDESLQTKTLQRLKPFGKPWIITSLELRDFTQKKALEAGFTDIKIVYEPVGRNTAPAIALLCRLFEIENRTTEVVGIFPADHLIQNEKHFNDAIKLASQQADKNKIVTLGLKPTYPATGYGYIQTQKTPYVTEGGFAGFQVKRFHEKPNQSLAESFLKEGSFFWNAGVFVFKIEKMIEQFKHFSPEIWNEISKLSSDLKNLKEVYSKLPNISIDYAILEKLSESDLACVPCNPGWSDVGSWDAVAQVYEETGRSQAKTIEFNSKNNFVMPTSGKTYAFVGVDNMIVVDTEDATLIAKKGETESVKQVVDRLKSEKSKLVSDHKFEERPWGRFDILQDQNHFKSKVISVNAKSQISYQSHAKREEHWVIVRGAGEVVLNNEVVPVKVGSYIKIPQGAKHRIRNTSSTELQFIEIQLGSYFGEDDIVRYEDDYSRVEG